MKNLKKLNSIYLAAGQHLGAMLAAPSRRQAQMGLFFLGVGLISLGLAQEAYAQTGAGLPSPSRIRYDDRRIKDSLFTILGYVEGSFGALVMVASGLGAILASAFGQYKAALGCLIVAVGSFILRSVMNTFFNVDAVR